MAPTVNSLRNIACGSFGIFFVLISAILMTQIYYTQQIDSQIQTISQLTDIKYPTWGQLPNPTDSSYTQKFSPYDLKLIDSKIYSNKSNISTTFDVTYEYQNTSFQQGNSGRLDFINKWELKETKYETEIQEDVINALNLGAEKIYNYDYYAPPQRKMTILYNSILETLTSDFLQLFYATYLFEYFFKNEELVLQTVFKPLKFDAQTSKNIYEDDILGWNSPQKLKNWAVLSLKGQDFAKKTPFYEQLVTSFSLSPAQISSLVFEKSTLFNMISALNGTIVTKVMQSKYFGYKCDGFCTNKELAAFQISSSFLTKDPLFASLGLQMKTKDFNTTFLADLEYTTFCESNPGLQCMPESTKASFFTNHYLGDFQMMNLIWKNQDKISYIQDQLRLPEGTGESVIGYILFIYENYIHKYKQVFSWTQTNHNNLQTSVTKYYQIFLVEIFARGFYNKFLLGQKKSSCMDYFQDLGDKICAEGSQWNLNLGLPVLRRYFKAFFFMENMREEFKRFTSFTDEQVIDFFNNNLLSLFSQQISQLEQIYSENFGCEKSGNKLGCSRIEMFCMEWGSGSILSNLPSAVFPNKVTSINEWDQDNVLNGLNPNYISITGEKIQTPKCKQILSSSTGVFSWFNLLKMGSTNVKENAKLLKYIATNVVEVGLKGLLMGQNYHDFFNGYNSTVIDSKKKMDVSQGGAPWLDNFITLIKTNNKAEIKNNQLLVVPQFDTINTGIYNSDETRQISRIWGQQKSSSKYVVYRGTKTDDDGKEVAVDIFEKYITDRKISGTNLFGFHPQIKEGENLQIYLTQAYQSFTLVFDKIIPSYGSEGIKAYSFKLSTGEEPLSFVGIEELNQNYLLLNDDSYFIIEPNTGISLQFQISYTVKSNPLFTAFLSEGQGEDSNLISLYDSDISYKRQRLNDFVTISSMASAKKSSFVYGMIVCVLALGVGIGLLVGIKIKFSKQERDSTLLQSYTSQD